MFERERKRENAFQMHGKMQSDWLALTKYYSFDPKKYKLEQFFADMKRFKDQYEVSEGNNVLITR